MYERLIGDRLSAGKRSVLILGPRQVGKSTLLKGLHPDRVIDLVEPSTFRDHVTDPEKLVRELKAAPSSVKTVFIDEVQKIPGLLDSVQYLIDEHPRRFRFLLSGSSARKLRRGGANLLPGRVHLHGLHPLVARELGPDFNLDRALSHGTLPGIWSQPDPEVRAEDLRGYVNVYLREEIQAEALVREIGGYARLLDLVAASSGTILNLSALGRDAGIRYETSRRYVQVLEDTLIVHAIPAWSGSTRQRLVAHPKLFFFDIGVRNAILRRPLDRCLADERGVLLEHLIAAELRARMGTIWPELELFHYRTAQGAEVDFIVEAGNDRWGIEVKAGRRVSPSDLSGLHALADRVKLTRRMVIYTGREREILNGVEILPIEDFLDELPA